MTEPLVEPQEPPPRRPKPLYRRLKFTAPVALLVLVLVGLVVWQASQPTNVERAVEACRMGGVVPDGVDIGDEGRSVSIDMMGEDETTGATLMTTFCVVGELDLPDYVAEDIENTRALDGRQQAEWDEMAASWSYHPDSGLAITIRETE